MNKFSVGDRVRCVNDSAYCGLEGTVETVRESFTGGFNYQIKFDNPATPGHGGPFFEASLEMVEEAEDLEAQTIIDDLQDQLKALTEKYSETLAVKDAALRIGAFVFAEYAKQHLAKETPESNLKAITNVGLERMMLDALEAD